MEDGETGNVEEEDTAKGGKSTKSGSRIDFDVSRKTPNFVAPNQPAWTM